MELPDKIKDILETGIVSDLFKAQRSLYVHRIIGKHSKDINNAMRYQREIFVLLQNLTFSDMTLALTKLYDKPNKHYPNRCILALIKVLKEYAEDSPTIILDHQLIETIGLHGLPDFLINDIKIKDYSGFTQHYALHLESMYNHPDLQQKIEELKSVRDKHIAHNEATTVQHRAQYKTFEDLISFCQPIVSVVGLAYFSKVYSLNEKYVLQDAAESLSYSILQLLIDLGIIEDRDSF